MRVACSTACLRRWVKNTCGQHALPRLCAGSPPRRRSPDGLARLVPGRLPFRVVTYKTLNNTCV